MDRRALLDRIARAITARCVRTAYRSGRRASYHLLAPEIRRLTVELAQLQVDADELQDDLTEAEAQYAKALTDAGTAHAKSFQILTDGHESEVRELKRQIATLTDSVEIRDQRIAQLAEVIQRDRERVNAETAEACRRIEELQNDPAITARPVNHQRG